MKAGSTSRRTVIFIQDSSSTTGAGLAGLAYNSASLVWYYWREDTGNAGGTSVTLASATRGTFTSGGFIEVDATNLPGFYEIGIPNAAITTGAKWCVMMLKGATNMAQTPIEIQLVSYDPDDSVGLGLSGVTIATQQITVKKNAALSGFQFTMVNTLGTGVTGLTVTAQRSIDGGAFSSCTNSVTEISNGWYKINLSASDLNGTTIGLRFSATSALDTNITLITQN